MTISIGESLPDATFLTMTSDGPAKATTRDVFGGRKVVLFAVPGAFTPTCTMNHLPGFLEHYETILSKGVADVAVVSVNDMHVMAHWAKSTRAEGKIRFLADGNGDFTKAIGLDQDLAIAGMGVRSKRYSMIVEDGVVKQLNIEELPGKADISGAARILEQL